MCKLLRGYGIDVPQRYNDFFGSDRRQSVIPFTITKMVEVQGHTRLIAIGIASLLFLGGCTELGRKQTPGEAQTLRTTAEDRMVTVVRPGPASTTGRVQPQQVVCLEPSPDVAKAVSEALNVAGGLDLSVVTPQTPAPIAAQATAAASRSRAEALAQLGQRLATIQLLRDGLYRACEAYANGAISDTMYAVLLGRYDDTMVTMLLAEIAAANFGQSLATLGTTGAGAAEAAIMQANADEQEAEQTRQKVEEVQTRREGEAEAISAKEEQVAQAGEEQRAAVQVELADLRAKLQRTDTELALALMKAAGDSAAAAQSSTTALVLTGVGELERDSSEQAAKIAELIGDMQREYLHDLNADALMVACIASMDRAPLTPLGQRCNEPIVGELINAARTLIEAARGLEEQGNADRNFELAVERVKACGRSCRRLAAL